MARPAGYFLDGLFDLMFASEHLEAAWRSALPTSPTPEPSSIDRFDSLWKLHTKLWDSDPQYPHEADGYHPDPRNTSFYLLIRRQQDAPVQLELFRQLASALRDWQDAALHMEGRAPCILPWLDSAKGKDSIYSTLLSTIRSLVDAVDEPSPSNLPVTGDLHAFAVTTAVVRTLVNDTLAVPLFSERQNQAAITPPSNLSPRSQEALVLFWRAGDKGLLREEMGALFSGRSADSAKNINFADTHVRTLRRLHGYPITSPPWRIEADKLPASYRQELDDLVSCESLEIDPKHD